MSLLFLILHKNCLFSMFLIYDFFFRPKAGRLSALFARQAMCISEASSCLLELLHEGDVQQRNELFHKITMCETQGDAVRTSLYDEIAETRMFRASLRKSDVQSIASMLDELLDHINDSARRIVIYRPKRIDRQLLELADYIHEDSSVLKEIIDKYSFPPKYPVQLMQQCERITRIEHESDEIFGDYMTYLFENEPDAVELIKYKSIVEALEGTTDCAKNVAELIRKVAFV